MNGTTITAFNDALIQGDILSVSATAHAFGAGLESRHLPEQAAVLFAQPLLLQQEFREPEIADLPAPQCLHRRNVQVLKCQRIKTGYQIMCSGPVKLFALVGDFAVCPCQIQPGFTTGITSFLLAGKVPVGPPDLTHGLLQRLGRVDLLPGGKRQECLEPEVRACGYASLDEGFGRRHLVAGERNVVSSGPITADGHGLDSSGDFPGLVEAEVASLNANPAGSDDLPATLFQCEALVFTA